MYVVSPTVVTPHTCFGLLSLLDSYNYDTTWIRTVWNSEGISDGWCAEKCIEIINREHYPIPNDYYGIRWIDETLDRVSSYYNSGSDNAPDVFKPKPVPTNTFPRY